LRKVQGHPNFPQLLGHGTEGHEHMISGVQRKVAFISLERLSNGDLFKLVAKRPFTEEICRYYFDQILLAVEHMHN
jgi:serine/threonine protein kinase